MVVTETEVQTGTELLTARQMAQFAIDGFLEFDDIVPQDLVEAVYEDEIKTVDENGLNERFRWHITDNPHGFYEFSEATREVQNLPAVKAVLRSLLGPGYQANHSALHATPPLHKEAPKVARGRGRQAAGAAAEDRTVLVRRPDGILRARHAGRDGADADTAGVAPALGAGTGYRALQKHRGAAESFRARLGG